MDYSIVVIGGKQYKVSAGDKLVVDRLEASEGDTLTLESVLFVKKADALEIGTPTVAKATVKAKVLSHLKGEKIRVATYKAKSRYRKVKGHRQAQTQLEIL